MYRLIIADDEENIRNGMAHSLPWREWGYEVVALCASGQEVLDQMESARPDVVLSDIRMPGMDGVELMQRLSRDYPQVKIVILSGYSDFKYLNMSIRNHVAEYLLKPTDIDDFEETFRRLKASMDHERLRRAQITGSVLRHFHAWLSALLGGVATPEDTDRFLPMLTEAGIDLDNLQIAAFVLDGHGGDERSDQAALWRRVWEAVAALPRGRFHRLPFLLNGEDLVVLYSSGEEIAPDDVRADIEAIQQAARDGALISSTDEAAVAAGQAPAALLASAAALGAGTDSIRLDGEQYNAAAAVCHSTDWRVLVLVPTRTLLASTFSLYFQILGVVALCLVVFAVLIWHFYRRFMAPLAQLEQAMRQADAGDLKAYVKPQGSVEVVRMMEGYNAMLDSLRTGIEQQMEMQRRRQDLEMQVLMSQINPHFLYNTLESIVWKAGEAGRPDIGKLASSLGKLYRLSISGGLFVPLEQELEHVQMYMNIQRSRYGNKVDYEVRLHRVDPDGVEVLKLILQPIVENSLLYGMDGLDHTLRIRVAAWRREGKLVLTVTDNGVGMDKAALAALRQQIIHGRKPKAEANYRSTGIGLHNIGARLRLYAGSTSCIKVQSKPGFGTRVTLELPWRDVEQPEPS